MHDFKKFPELTNAQMNEFYFESPHKQIVFDFKGKVEKVHDGDTISVSTDFRNFNTTIRLANIASAELSESGGDKSRKVLDSLINGEVVDILINPNNRVGKFGRIIGEVIHLGININEEMIRRNEAVDFETRKMNKLPNFEKELEAFRI